MSYKFPDNQKFKKRICFHCKKRIDIGDYFVTNKSLYDIERLIQLWEDDRLEFYCCLCYEQHSENEKLSKLKASLSEKEQEILNLLKLKFSINIPIVNEIQYNTVGVTIQNKHITGLGLFKSVVTFPEEITMLTSLEKLNLAWNSLKELPKSICNLRFLKELDLIGNQLSSIPEEIGQLNSLVKLDISFNNLTAIPETIGTLNSLKILNLVHNNIIKLPESFNSLEDQDLKVLL